MNTTTIANTVYAADAAPQPWLERQAASAPLWARLAALHLRLFPNRGNGRVHRTLRRWGEGGPSLFRITLAGGLKWLIDLKTQPRYAEYVGPLCIEGAEWHIIEAFRRLVRPGDCVLDVGANRGYFTILFRRLVGASGKVIAFEPVGLTRSYLHANLRLNGLNDVLVCEEGASDSEAEVEIEFNPQALGCTSLHPHDAAGAMQRTTLHLRPLDAILAGAKAPPPAFIKIDVEGHEFAAMQGAKETIARHQPMIVFEAARDHGERAGWSLETIEQFLTGLAPYRFSVVRWSDGMLEHLQSPLKWDVVEKLGQNIAAWVPGKHQERIDGCVARG